MNAGKRKKAFLSLSIILLLFLLTCSFYSVKAESTTGGSNKRNMDLVIVLDRTASLQLSDPNMLSRQAAKLILDLMVQNGSKIGFVQYTDKVTDRLDITDINGLARKNDLKSYIDKLGVPKGKSTDLSSGLKEGVSMLAGLHTLENPIVILLSDGKNDFDGSDRTQDISQRDMAQTLEVAKNKGIVLYTIGLNADGTVDKELLSRIAKETGGKSYIVQRANDLPDIICDVYSDALGYRLMSLGPDRIRLSGDFEPYLFDVVNSSVEEANIVIYKNNDLEVKLFSPDGTEVSWDNTQFIAADSPNYRSYKIINPKKGQWRLMVKGARNNEIKISLLYNYDLVLLMDPLSSSAHTGSEIPVKAYLMSQGWAIKDKDLYKDMSAVLVVENLATNVSEKVTLTAGENDYQGKIKFEQAGNYNVYMRAEGKDLIRKSDSQRIQITENIAQGMVSTKNALLSKKFLIISLRILSAIVLAILLFKGISKLIETAKPKLLFGKIDLRVIDTISGREEMQLSKALASYGSLVTLGQLVETPSHKFNDIVFVRKTQGICLTYSNTDGGDLSVSINGERVTPGQIVRLSNRCSVRVVTVDDSQKIEGRFHEF